MIEQHFLWIMHLIYQINQKYERVLHLEEYIENMSIQQELLMKMVIYYFIYLIGEMKRIAVGLDILNQENHVQHIILGQKKEITKLE